MSAATLAPPDPTTTTPPPKATLPGTAAPPPGEADEPLYGGLDGLWRFSVTDYQAMIKAGILGKRTPVELLDGLVVTHMPRGPVHDNAIFILTRRLDRAAPDGWVVRGQSGATLSDESEPEPDVLVARGDERTFFDRHPGPADAALVVEVSDSSLRRDTREKLAIYAAAGVAEYWVVNVPDRRVQVYSRPAGTNYTAQALFGTGQSVSVTLDGVVVATIAVADLFPRPQTT